MSLTPEDREALVGTIQECMAELADAGEPCSVGVAICGGCHHIHWLAKCGEDVLLELRLPLAESINLDADLRVCITKAMAMGEIMGSA